MNQRLFVSFAFVLVILFATVVSAQNSSTAALVDEGFKFLDKGQYDQAILKFKKAIELDPSVAEAHRLLGVSYREAGRLRDAMEHLEAAVRLNPNDYLGHFDLGINLLRLRRSDDAFAALDQARRLNPKDGDIYGYLGNLMGDTGRFEEAINFYRQAAEIVPDQPVNFHNIGAAYVQLGKFAEAVAPLEKALKMRPGNPRTIFLLANALSRLGRYKESTEAWTKLLSVDPNNANALSSRAWNHLYAGDGKEAGNDARAYVKKFGWKTESAPFQAVIAVLGFRSVGMLADSNDMLEAAIKNVGRDAWTYQIILYLNGQLNAQGLLELARNNDNRTEAHTYLGLDKRIKGDLVGAAAHFEWVRDFGNRQFLEYALAFAELKRITN